jgi:hypothetical protein
MRISSPRAPERSNPGNVPAGPDQRFTLSGRRHYELPKGAKQSRQPSSGLRRTLRALRQTPWRAPDGSEAIQATFQRIATTASRSRADGIASPRGAKQSRQRSSGSRRPLRGLGQTARIERELAIPRPLRRLRGLHPLCYPRTLGYRRKHHARSGTREGEGPYLPPRQPPVSPAAAAAREHARSSPGNNLMLTISPTLTPTRDAGECVRKAPSLGGGSDSHHSLRHELTFAETG